MSDYLDYNVNVHGMIIDAGRFEGEPTFVPYFWNMLMDGFADDEYVDSYDYAVAVFKIEKKDSAQFPELTEFSVIELWLDDNGFCHHRLFESQTAHEKHMSDDAAKLAAMYPEDDDDL